MIKINWAVIILFCCGVSLSGCSLYNLDIVKNNDNTNTVRVYTFGCQNYLPDIYIDEQDLSVWQYCPYGNKGQLWKAGPTEDEEDDFVRSVPEKFKPIDKVSLQKCGDIIYDKYPTILYCGESLEAGYKFKLWKDTKGIWKGLESNNNYLEYNIVPLSPEMMKAKAKEYSEKKRLKEIRLREEAELARQKQIEEAELAQKKQREEEELAQKKQREEEELAQKKQREEEELARQKQLKEEKLEVKGKKKKTKESLKAQKRNMVTDMVLEAEDFASLTETLDGLTDTFIGMFDAYAKEQNIKGGDIKKLNRFKSDFRKCTKNFSNANFREFDACFQNLTNSTNNFSNYKFRMSMKIGMVFAGVKGYYPMLMLIAQRSMDQEAHDYYKKRFLDLSAMGMELARDFPSEN